MQVETMVNLENNYSYLIVQDIHLAQAEGVGGGVEIRPESLIPII